MLKQAIIIFSVAAAFVAACHPADLKPIERLDPTVDAILPPDAKVETVASNLIYGLEGPVWIRKGGYLLFSGMNTNIIYKFNPKDNQVSNFLEHAGFTGTDPTGLGGQTNYEGKVYYSIGPNGATLDPHGLLVFCAHGDRDVVRVEKDGRRTVLASRYEGKRLNSPVE